jgi:Zn-dependent protease
MNLFLHPTAIIAILLAISIHEWAHGYVAHRLGDPTAREEGRLTLNPIAHLDPIGTILFLLIGFGWGKPVPIDPRYFRHPKRDSSLVALAGPVSNLLLASIAFAGLVILAPRGMAASAEELLSMAMAGSPVRVLLLQICGYSVFINLALMAFNLLPVAPLDGSKILHAFIPLRYEDRYQELMQRGPMTLLFLIVAERLLGIPLLIGWVHAIMNPILLAMAFLAGFFL